MCIWGTCSEPFEALADRTPEALLESDGTFKCSLSFGSMLLGLDKLSALGSLSVSFWPVLFALLERLVEVVALGFADSRP